MVAILLSMVKECFRLSSQLKLFHPLLRFSLQVRSRVTNLPLQKSITEIYADSPREAFKLLKKHKKFELLPSNKISNLKFSIPSQQRFTRWDAFAYANKSICTEIYFAQPGYLGCVQLAECNCYLFFGWI